MLEGLAAESAHWKRTGSAPVLAHASMAKLELDLVQSLLQIGQQVVNVLNPN